MPGAELQIHQDDVRGGLAGQCRGLPAAAGLADDLDAGGAVQQGEQAGAYDGVVIADEDADRGGPGRPGWVGHRGSRGIAADRAVPSPGADSTVRVPPSWRKAYTAVSWNAPTSELAKRLAQAPNLNDIPGTQCLAGGSPVTAKGAPVAGIGVAGARSGDLDEKYARAGAAVLGD